MKRTLIYSFIAIVFTACSSPKAEENHETAPTNPAETVEITNPVPTDKTDSFSVHNPTSTEIDTMKFITLIKESELIYETKINELQKAIKEREETLGKMSNTIENLQREKEADKIADSIYHTQTAAIIDTLTGKTNFYSGQISQIREILDSPEQK